MVRVLVCGDPSEDPKFVAKKLTAFCSKSGPFAFAVLLHPPFSSDPGVIPPSDLHFPVPTYFASQSDFDDGFLESANLNCVGAASALLCNGLTVFLLAAGYDDPPSATSCLPPEVETALVEAGAKGAGFRGVDMLVSPTLPRGVSIQQGEGSPSLSTLVARVAITARPRYHFASGRAYNALAPFRVPGAVHATRLFSLATAKKGKGERWLYAADVAPLAGMSVEALAATRASPVLRAPYVVDMGTGGSVSGDGLDRKRNIESNVGPGKRKRVRSGNQIVRTPRDAKCWFCLASEKDVHLVLSVGEHFYVAAAKGGIVPQHLLIIPVNHVRHSLDPALTSNMRAEINAYKKAIGRYYEETMDGAKPYFFERAVTTRGGDAQAHMHIQCVPIKHREPVPASSIAVKVAKSLKMGDVEVLGEGSDCISRLEQLQTERLKGKKSGVDAFEFFWAELPDGGRIVQNVSAAKTTVTDSASPAIGGSPFAGNGSDGEGEGDSGPETELDGKSGSKAEPSLGRLPPSSGADIGTKGSESRPTIGRRPSGHPLQYGRMIATELLGLPQRVDWKLCVGVFQEEKRGAAKVRDEFADYEPDLGN